MPNAHVPELTRDCNSWIATSPDGSHYRETWSRDAAQYLANLGWTVRTAHDHLTNLNAQLRSATDAR